MRSRLVVLASLLAALVVIAVPSAVVAAPAHNHGLTIAATPNPNLTGDAVLVYGQLNIKNHANRLIVLYHRVNPAKSFSPVATTHTDPQGFYEFKRSDVTTNRSWYVTGPNGTHSRTVHELVLAEVTLKASSLTGNTNHPITFTGHVEPNHAGERVVLQAQQGLKGDDWRDVASGKLGLGSNYSITHSFSQPGERDLRVLFRGDSRNVRSVSDTITVTIQQTQNATFTINASSQNIQEGSSVTIFGKLFMKGSTSTPDPGQTVQLWGHDADHKYAEITSTTTQPDGSYTFTQKPTFDEVYQVRTITPPVRKTAQLFEGVSDLVTLTAPTTATVGQTVTFTGSVSPDKSGHVIDLQRLGTDGDWHTVSERHVSSGSTYSIPWTFGSPGTKEFRTLVPGGELNSSGHSPTATIIVTLPPVMSLPPAS